MNTEKANEMQVARMLVSNKSNEIDLKREFSHGPGGAKTFIDEQRNGSTISWTIENQLAVDKVIVIGSLNNSQFADEASLLAAVGGDLLLDDGDLLEVGGLKVIGSCNDADRLIGEVLRYGSNSGFRFTAVSLESSKTNGDPDTSNFTGSIKSIWVSPFRKSKDTFLQLRKFQSNQSNSPQFADVNFIQEGFPAVISAENFLAVTIKKGTALNLTLSVGMQDSRAQRMYRAFRAADATLAPIR